MSCLSLSLPLPSPTWGLRPSPSLSHLPHLSLSPLHPHPTPTTLLTVTDSAATATVLAATELGTVDSKGGAEPSTSRTTTLITDTGTADQVAALNLTGYKVGQVKIRLPLPPKWQYAKLHYTGRAGWHNSRTLSKPWLKKITDGMKTCPMTCQPIHLHFSNPADKIALTALVTQSKDQEDISNPTTSKKLAAAHTNLHAALLDKVMNPSILPTLPDDQSPVIPMIGQHTLKALQDMSNELYEWMRVKKQAKHTTYTPTDATFPYAEVLNHLTEITEDKTLYSNCPPNIKSILNFFSTNPQLTFTLLVGLPDKTRLQLVTLTNQNYIGFPNTFQTYLYNARCYLKSLIPGVFSHRASMSCFSLPLTHPCPW